MPELSKELVLMLWGDFLFAESRFLRVKAAEIFSNLPFADERLIKHFVYVLKIEKDLQAFVQICDALVNLIEKLISAGNFPHNQPKT